MPYICLKNNKGKKVAKGLVLDQCKWKELEDIVTKNERLAKQAEENARVLQERKDLSAKMQSEWDNTYVNMRKKRFEEMEARRVMADTEREKKYWQLRREEQDLREQITSRARYVLSQERDCNKNINRALVLAETLRERKAQVDFNNCLRQKELDREIEYAKSIKEDVEEFKKEENEIKQRGSQKREKLKEESLKILQETQETKIKEELEKKAEGREELKRLAREIKEDQEKERQEKIRQRELAISNIEENIRIKEEFKRKMQRLEEEEDTKIRIISEAKKRLNEERKKKEKEDQAAGITKRNKIAQAVAAEVADLEATENAIIEKSLAEKDALHEKRNKDDEAHVQKLKAERIDAYQAHLQEEEKKRQDDYELTKWNMMQRFKKDEAIKKFEADIARRIDDATRKSRIIWNQQIKERQMKEQKEIEEDVDALNRANEVWRNEDQDFIKYAEEILEECKKIGRPTYPIETALKEYKKSISLLPRRPLSATWKSNIPINNPAVEEEAVKRQINRPRIRPKCACVPRNGV